MSTNVHNSIETRLTIHNISLPCEVGGKSGRGCLFLVGCVLPFFGVPGLATAFVLDLVFGVVLEVDNEQKKMSAGLNHSALKIRVVRLLKRGVEMGGNMPMPVHLWQPKL